VIPMPLIHATPQQIPNKSGFRKQEQSFQLDPSKLSQYRFMIENRFRTYGPSKSKISVRTNKKTSYPLLAGINPDNWDVDFTMRESLTFRKNPELIRYMEKHNITDPIARMLTNVADHEIGHWEYPRGSFFGCPYDKPTYYTSFIEPIYEELKNTGKLSEGMCKSMSQRLSNAVSDVIDNHNVAGKLAERSKPYSGQVLFWYLQGQENGRYTDEYTLFVKLNLALFGNKDDYNLIEKFMSESKEMGEAVSRLIKVFTTSAIYDKDEWETLARAYAREAIKFLTEDKPKHQYSGGDGTAKPSKGKKEKGKGKQDEKDGQSQDEGEEDQDKNSGSAQGEDQGEKENEEGESESDSESSGEQGEEESDEEEGQGSEGNKEGEEENEDNDKDGKGEVEPGKELSGQDIEKIMGGRKAGQGIPFYIKTEEALDAYYKSLAKRIRIKVSAGKLPSAQFKIVPIVREPYNPEIHSAEDAETGKLYYSPTQRKMVPSVVKTRLAIDVPIRKEKRNMPDFVFSLIDSSGSMMGQGEKRIVPWGDKSYYHYALLTYFGILRFFELEGLLHKIKVSTAIFSDVTLGAKGLKDVKNLLFNPASGGTRLDIRKVMDVVAQKQDAMFSMISDGDIANWSSLKDEFIQLARRHQFFMIQIGGESQTSTDLRSAALNVQTVSSHEDIVKLAIDLTTKGYHQTIARKLAQESKKYRNW